jgi:hypothetical protein
MKIVGLLFEYMRVILILFIGFMVIGYVEKDIIKILHLTSFEPISNFISAYLLIIVLYRNKLQFTGWFRSKTMRPYSKQVTYGLLVVSFILFIVSIGVSNF